MVSPNLTNEECNPLSGRTRQERRVHFDESADSIDGSAATNDATNTLSGPESSNEAATTRNGSDEMSEIEARDILLNHPLPKARQRTNIVSEDYVPEGRLFGAFTTRGEGYENHPAPFFSELMALKQLLRPEISRILFVPLINSKSCPHSLKTVLLYPLPMKISTQTRPDMFSTTCWI